MKRLTTSALTLALSTLAVTGTASEQVRIVTGFERPTDCISKVQINNIDDQEVRVPSAAFNLEPGRHVLTGRAIVNSNFCPTIGDRHGVQRVEPLEAEFEAGKTYYVGYDHSSKDRADWGLVIWKVKEG